MSWAIVTPSGRDSSSTRTACLEPIRQGLTGSPVGLRSVPRRARGFGSPFAFACFAAGRAAASCCFSFHACTFAQVRRIASAFVPKRLTGSQPKEAAQSLCRATSSGPVIVARSCSVRVWRFMVGSFSSWHAFCLAPRNYSWKRSEKEPLPTCEKWRGGFCGAAGASGGRFRGRFPTCMFQAQGGSAGVPASPSRALPPAPSVLLLPVTGKR